MLSSTFTQSFPPTRRIRQRAEFEKVFRAERLTNKWFMVYVRKNDIGLARLGLVISKSTMPKAVTRNFAKRLVREVFRRSFPAECAFDVVVRARRQINIEDATEGRKALEQLLQAMQE